MPRILAAAVVSMAMLLGACAAGPAYVRPQIAAPPGYRGDGMNGGPERAGGSGSLGELRWQELIQDEELAKLIREALVRNFDAQIAAARVLEARAQLSGSRAARLPSADVLGGYNSGRASELGITGANLATSLGWELDLWGRIRSTNQAARAALLATEEARHAVLGTLVSDVAGAYFLLRDLDLEIEITRRALKLREESLNLVQLRVDNGYSSELELRQAEVLVKGAQTALTGLELQNEQAENQLGLLLGRNPGPIARGRSLLDQGISPVLPPGLPSTLLDRRPDIREAEQRLIGDHALVSAARAAFFPTISLTGSTGFASSALLSLFRAASGEWIFGPAASLPVFHAGAIQSVVRGAAARREQSLLTYQKTVQQAFREVADALVSRRKLADLRIQQETLVESLRQGVELADLAYQGGVASYLEFLDAERQLLDAELLLAQVRRQELTNMITLYRSLGGGWQ